VDVIDEISPLLERVVERLRCLDGLRAIVLGGSLARRTADVSSDIDLGLYYDSQQPFGIEDLDQAARELDDRGQAGLVTDFGEWGPGVNGGGWLLVGGRHVDFLYRDLRAVRRAIDQCRAGQPRTLHQLGHPLGFHNQIYAAEVDSCSVLFDPAGAVAALKSLVTQYPQRLRTALVSKHLFDAGFELAAANKPALRGDVVYVAGCLFRAAGSMTLVLYALNRRWFINEKGALAQVGTFPLAPHRFQDVVKHATGHPGLTPAELTDSIARLHDLLGELKLLAQTSDCAV